MERSVSLVITRLRAAGLAIALSLLAVAFAGSAFAEPRIALVIGNADYGGDLGRLLNPANDARLMAKTLKSIGFEVIAAENADQAEMKRAIQDFGARLTQAGGGSTGLFFYAGHGLQVAGTNYLIPIHAKIAREPDVEFEAVPIDLVMKQMAFADAAVNIVILDACRNNPLSRGFRSAARGLADPAVRPMGSFIAYSTAPGDVAEDGKGANSPYTTALAELISRPGASINDVFQEVRGKVLAATDRKQVPWDASSLTAPFYFVPAAIAAEPNPVELAFWDAIKDSKLADDYRAYLGKYPTGAFAPLAQVRLKQFEQTAAGESSAGSQMAERSDPSDLRSADIESAFWEAVESDGVIDGYRAYLEKFPQGRFVDSARTRLSESGAGSAVAAMETPPAATETTAYLTVPLLTDSQICLPDGDASSEDIADSCRRLLAAGISDDTERYNTQLYLGNALFNLGRDDEAMANYQAAIDLDPAFYAAHHWMGRVLLRKERYKEAQAAFDKAIALDPTKWPPILYRGATLRRLGKVDAAMDDIERSIALDPAVVEAYHERSFVHLTRAELAAATADAEHASQIDPLSLSAAGFFSLYLSGRPEEALVMAQRAAAHNPDALHWLIWKAVAERATSAAPAAKATLAAARSLAGKDEWRQTLIDYIDGRISESEARRRALVPNRQASTVHLAELDFYCGERAALEGDLAGAKAAFGRVMESRLYGSVEYAVAPAWIAQLGGS